VVGWIFIIKSLCLIHFWNIVYVRACWELASKNGIPTCALWALQCDKSFILGKSKWKWSSLNWNIWVAIDSNSNSKFQHGIARMDKHKLASFLLNVKDSSLQHVNIANEQQKKTWTKTIATKNHIKKMFWTKQIGYGLKMMKDMFVIVHVNNFKSLISQLSLARTIIIDVRNNISHKIEEHGSMAI
jgi:hypothetical protein